MSKKANVTAALTVKVKWAPQVCLGKVKPLKPVPNVLIPRVLTEATMPKEAHQVKVPVLETAKIQPLVASDAANSDKLEKEIL